MKKILGIVILAMLTGLTGVFEASAQQADAKELSSRPRGFARQRLQYIMNEEGRPGAGGNSQFDSDASKFKSHLA